MKSTTIKNKLLVLTLFSVSISFLILGFYNTYNNYSSEYNLIKQKELDLAQETSKSINNYLQSKIDIVEAVAHEVSSLNLDVKNKEIIDKLRLGNLSGKFSGLYLGIEENGNFLQYDATFRTPQTHDYDSRKRPWYKKAVETNKVGISEPYIDYSTKKLVISVSAPIKKDGKIIGVIGSDIALDTVVNTVLNINLNEEGFAYLTDFEGKTIIHKDEKELEKQNEIYAQVKSNNSLHFGEALLNNNPQLIAYSNIPITNWKLVIQLDKNAISKKINENLIKEIFLYVFLLIIILGILFYALVKILSPLKTFEEGLNFFFKYLKGEEKNIIKLNINTNDELGKMALEIDKQMEIIAKNLEEDKALINEVKMIVNRVKEGNLDLQIKQKSSNESLNELKSMLNDMIKTISLNVNQDINTILVSLEEYSKLDFVKNISNPTGNVAIGLNNLSNIINQMLQENKSNGLVLDKSSNLLLNNVNLLNKTSNETAVALEETAAALEEITSTVINNTERISIMANHSKELSISIEDGQKLANITVESMDSINEQTQAIAEAITIIDQIAFQTNILSLNAAVEAATAGEAGRGFAVVAQEVRNLASRSAEAAREIKELVENATNKTNSGKKIADDMIKGYVKLKENISKTTEVIHDISISSKEQRTSIEQINDVITKLDRQTQNNASIANETHDIAINTSNIAQKILETVNQKKFRNN
ncbi:methyl-accepting chemotaxis protein [Arcobacter ellisii]|uniref:Cache sensor-containing MCP-domain signal transduction protein n=1 Tax=Arcobacter ellisii TaxID=913109 RepID=A0A347UAA1_9BACT|nr:methyl-accepting chemotaxis protein [Arcobacter ellisii]AXX95779.1 Cache sensor-containing MCP-domain signal transduction protein [Arcobacter ellisii]RXI29117.1 chemotaxis protein [Arcobacter ellisii]